MYWIVVRSASGVVSERRFSGSDLTPNREQILWTVINTLLDEGINVFAENINETPDFYIYELSQHVPIEELAKQYNTDINTINAKIKNYIDKLFEYKEEMEKADLRLKQQMNKIDEV